MHARTQSRLPLHPCRRGSLVALAVGGSSRFAVAGGPANAQDSARTRSISTFEWARSARPTSTSITIGRHFIASSISPRRRASNSPATWGTFSAKVPILPVAQRFRAGERDDRTARRHGRLTSCSRTAVIRSPAPTRNCATSWCTNSRARSCSTCDAAAAVVHHAPEHRLRPAVVRRRRPSGTRSAGSRTRTCHARRRVADFCPRSSTAAGTWSTSPGGRDEVDRALRRRTHPRLLQKLRFHRNSTMRSSSIGHDGREVRPGLPLLAQEDVLAERDDEERTRAVRTPPADHRRTARTSIWPARSLRSATASSPTAAWPGHLRAVDARGKVLKRVIRGDSARRSRACRRSARASRGRPTASA